jgi:hypothetical protein
LDEQTERWAFEDVEQQILNHRDDAALPMGERQARGLIATRHKVACELCGDDLTTGDLLGTGFVTVERRRQGEPQPSMLDDLVSRDERVARFGDRSATRAARDSDRFVIHERLSLWADSGASCLSLTALRRILTLP